MDAFHQQHDVHEAQMLDIILYEERLSELVGCIAKFAEKVMASSSLNGFDLHFELSFNCNEAFSDRSASEVARCQALLVEVRQLEVDFDIHCQVIAGFAEQTVRNLTRAAGTEDYVVPHELLRDIYVHISPI